MTSQVMGSLQRGAKGLRIQHSLPSARARGKTELITLPSDPCVPFGTLQSTTLLDFNRSDHSLVKNGV